ncbi:hypothetical protein [Paenirhodobacter sp.]
MLTADWPFHGRLIGPAQAAGMARIILGTLGVRHGWRFAGRRS